MIPLLSDCLWVFSSSLITALSVALSHLKAWSLSLFSYTWDNSLKLFLWYVSMEYSATHRILLWCKLLFLLVNVKQGVTQEVFLWLQLRKETYKQRCRILRSRFPGEQTSNNIAVDWGVEQLKADNRGLLPNRKQKINRCIVFKNFTFSPHR